MTEYKEVLDGLPKQTIPQIVLGEHHIGWDGMWMIENEKDVNDNKNENRKNEKVLREEEKEEEEEEYE